MLIGAGVLIWAAIGAILGLIVNSDAFAQGWSEVEGGDPSASAEKRPADDLSDRRLVAIGTAAAVVAGLVSMVVIIGESVIGLLASLPVAAIAATAVLLVVSAIGLTTDHEHGDS